MPPTNIEWTPPPAPALKLTWVCWVCEITERSGRGARCIPHPSLEHDDAMICADCDTPANEHQVTQNLRSKRRYFMAFDDDDEEGLFHVVVRDMGRAFFMLSSMDLGDATEMRIREITPEAAAAVTTCYEPHGPEYDQGPRPNLAAWPFDSLLSDEF